MNSERITLRVNPQVAELLLGEESHVIASLEQKISKQIMIYPNPDLHLEEFNIFEVHEN
jgi:ribonuclease G